MNVPVDAVHADIESAAIKPANPSRGHVGNPRGVPGRCPGEKVSGLLIPETFVVMDRAPVHLRVFGQANVASLTQAGGYGINGGHFWGPASVAGKRCI